MAVNAALDSEQRLHLVHHVFLPPKLPQKADDSERALIKTTSDALIQLRKLLTPKLSSAAIDNAIYAVRSLQRINGGPTEEANEAELKSNLNALADRQTLIARVNAQNAGIMITRKSRQLIFEQFELSPTNESVTAAKGRLVRTFPGTAVALDDKVTKLGDFGSVVAATISQMSKEAVPSMQPTSKKAGSRHEEIRDTTEPAIVSELLFGFFRGLGEEVSVSAISKNMRDEVLWNQALLPWRRSPTWTLIRVALQLVITRASDGSRELYKVVLTFIMSYILSSSQDLSTDVLHVMEAKIGRRMHKLSAANTHSDALMHHIKAIIMSSAKKASVNIDTRWTEIQERDSREIDLSALALLNFEKDALIAIPKLDEYLSTISHRQASNKLNTFSPHSDLLRNQADRLPSLPSTSSGDRYIIAANLQQFEQWVALYLAGWLTDCEPETACEKLSSLLTQYHRLADQYYTGNPEGISLMLLTILELWTACDTITVQISPLVGEYNADVPSDMLQSLLLPSLEQMKRLHAVETHLDSRRRNRKMATLLFDLKSRDSLSNKYFDTSTKHQNLLATIKSQAKVARDAKVREFDTTKAEHRRLDQLQDGVEHTYVTKVIDSWCDPPETEEVHSPSCQKCSYIVQRDSLRIVVHESPLPSDPQEAKGVVFELDVPNWLRHWRDLRAYLLDEVLKGQLQQPDVRADYRLASNDPHLSSQYYQRGTSGRIGLQSRSKPVVRSHYAEKKIPGLEKFEVCVDNGLRYQYYDATTGKYVATPSFTDKVPRSCTYSLSHQPLQQFIFRPASMPDGPQPNVAIASQADCPDSMTTEEYLALTTLPLGHHIQWANILLQLEMPGVDFKKADNTLVMLQCIYQAGPSASNAARESHNIFEYESEALRFLECLEQALMRVKDNFESAQAVRIAVSIAARVLTLTAHSAVTVRCLAFLSDARVVLTKWLDDLTEKTTHATTQSDRTLFLAKRTEVALITLLTFDIDDGNMATLLCEHQNVEVLAYSNILVHEGTPSQSHVQEQHLTLLSTRASRLLHRVYKQLSTEHTGLDQAIQKFWSGFHPGSGWRTVSDAADHWITTTTGAVGGTVLHVHCNLLSGELLVNGLPLDRPPSNYCNQPLYSTLFGSGSVEVLPSPIPGFQFSTKRAFGGYAVHLSVSATAAGAVNQLVVRAISHDASMETIPGGLLSETYPSHFSEDYVHWYNPCAGTIEFRPVSTPWQASPGSWKLSKEFRSGLWRLHRGGCSVVGLEQPTSKATFGIFGCLAPKSRIHSIVQPSCQELKVEMPAFRLNFSLAHGTASLVSKEYRSMLVDQDQSIGSLIGLQDRVVLRSATTKERLVLIAESKVDYTAQNGHVVVRTSAPSTVKVHAMVINNLLGRLIDDGETGSKLYLAYLHALTSFCRPDPLTGKTGTEQALMLLENAGLRSFDQLSQANADMLSTISALTPGRCYYPRHETVMQTVSWDSQLSFLSQHHRFLSTARSIIEQSKRAGIFFSNISLRYPPLDKVDEHLSQRDSIRSSAFRVPGFGAEDHSSKYDVAYPSRDRGHGTQRAMNASLLATLVSRDAVRTHFPRPLAGSLWKTLKASTTTIQRRDVGLKSETIRYDASTLTGALGKVAVRFLALHRRLPELWQTHQLSVIIWLSTLAFSGCDMDILQVLAMFCRSPEIAQTVLPTDASFSPKEGTTIQRPVLESIIRRYRNPQANAQYQLERLPNEKMKKYSNRKSREWQTAIDLAISQMLAEVASHWPCEIPAPVESDAPFCQHIATKGAMAEIRAKFQAWHDNGLLKAFLSDIERPLSFIRASSIQPIALVVNEAFVASKSKLGFLSEEAMFRCVPPIAVETPPVLENTSIQKTDKSKIKSAALAVLLRRLRSDINCTRSEREYTEDLETSLDAFLEREEEKTSSFPSLETFTQYQDIWEMHAEDVYEQLRATLASQCTTGALFPRLSKAYILQQLSHEKWLRLSTDWRLRIVEYALAVSAGQRAQRMVTLCGSSRQEDLLAELRTPGHRNWDPMEYPETLLMEVESGITVREVQEQIAAEMRIPHSNSNAVMQLNMGEGKSSVIVPMVASALADRSQLVRVIVAKPQSKQMAQMLISKIGGLLNRRVYYLPFSRSLQLSGAQATVVLDILVECMSTGGVLLVQPEHILSFQLMAPESYIDGKQDIGRALLSVQDFFDCNARDIVDESDENFSPKYELIYTMGSQKSIEASPDRWLLVHRVLDIVRVLVADVAKALPASIEVPHTPSGSFPRVRILRADGEQALLQLLAQHICNYGIEGLRVARQPEHIRKAIHTYISQAELSTAEISAVENTEFWSESTRQPLLLIRGLIAGGILSFTLQKRWRVHYGLASRSPLTKLAVPYRAKDSPTPRSEFSHPDVVIMLTSLSHYYDGLNDDDMYTALGHLVESDQSNIEFQAWVRDSPGLPDSFKQLAGVNLQDRPQCQRMLFPALHRSKSVVDYFLAHHVFPKEMKEFPSKLTVSGWDLGKRKSKLTTGFSGTDDSRRLLPIDVAHLSLKEQKHTNAQVLEYILRPENSVKLLPPVKAGTSDSQNLLDAVLGLDPAVHVILDVGAQILELDNQQVAKTWLAMHDASKEAAIFVNEKDEICVIDRDDQIDLLRTSSYQSRLDCCLVFLDEAHTRGIDLQLPVKYRAAVTLGAGLTKDRLVQACMRMRKFGKGQTVVFCISPEIQAKILEKTSKSSSLDINVEDVLLWSITETHAETQRSMPLWAVQGERFVRQEKLWQQVQIDGKTTLTKPHAEKLLEDEAQSLDDRYRPRQAQTQPAHLANSTDPRLKLIADRCSKFENLQFNSSTLQEEQERELSPEVEQERQIERAPSAQPMLHSLHKDIKAFVRTGTLLPGSEAVISAFQAFHDSSAAKSYSLAHLKGDRRLLVSADFARTVKKSSLHHCSDLFQRPVQWLLSNCKADKPGNIDCIVVISPFEANLLFVRMRASKATALHMFKPRINSGFTPLDELAFYTTSARLSSPVVPRSLAVRLSLFAGQLYISSYTDYLEICKFMGLCAVKLTGEMSMEGWKVGADGFILSDDAGRVGGDSGLQKSPVNFFKIVIETIRRNGDSVAKTDMGALLEGKLFQQSDFE